MKAAVIILGVTTGFAIAGLAVVLIVGGIAKVRSMHDDGRWGE